MDDEGILSPDPDSMQMFWAKSSNTEDDIYSDKPSNESFSDCRQVSALNEHLSKSVPDLAKNLDSTHYLTSRRLCKSAGTLLPKRSKQSRDHKCVPYIEFESNGAVQHKSRSSSKASISAEKGMLHIGNENQSTAPLDYTLCLADYRTNWNLSENSTVKKSSERLNINTLAKHLNGLLVGYAILLETEAGSLVAEFTNLEDMDRVLRLPLAKIFGTKLKSWRISRRRPYSPYQQPSQNTQLSQQYYQRPNSPLSSSTRHYLRNYNCYSYRRYLIAPDIPDTVPAPEIQNALRFQGLCTGQVWRHMPRGFSIEVLRPCDYERLRRDGVNFFNVAAFPVYPYVENLTCSSNFDCHTKYTHNKIAEPKTEAQETATEMPFAILQQAQHRENIQCFKCQRYGHKATHCKYWTRCVRCGGKHKVCDCDVPKSEANCCLCKGAHHAASQECPVHRVHANAVQVSFSMARTSANLRSSSFEGGGNSW